MRDRTQALIVASSTLLVSVLVWFNYSAVLPLVADEWSLSGVQAGVLFSAFQVGYILAIIPAGRLTDRRPSRWIIAAGAFGTGAASLGFAWLSAGLLSGTVWRLLAGVFMAGVYIPGMRFVSEWYPERVRGRAMGFYVGSFSIGSGLSFFLGARIASVLDWRTAVAATSLGALVAGPILLALTRDPPDVSKAESAIDLSVLQNSTYRYAVGIYSGHNWELFGVRSWILAFLVTVPAIAARPDTTAIAGLIAGALMAIGGLGNIVGGFLSDRLGRARTIGLMIGSGSLITLSIGFLDWLSLPVLVALVLLWGVVLTADSAPTSTAITEVVADENVGVALSLQSVVGFSVTIVSPVAFGAVLDYAGYRFAFPILAVGGFFGLGAAMLLGRSLARG